MTDPPEKPAAEPSPLVRTPKKQSIEEAIAEQDAADQREWEMLELREKTKQLKALFANRAYVDPSGKHLRISFGETVGDEDVYHSAVVIPLEEAHELGQLLVRMTDAWLRVMWEQQRKWLADNPSPLGDSDKPDA